VSEAKDLALSKSAAEAKSMIAGVDIGGTKVAVGIVDSAGKVLAAEESPTGAECEYARGLDLIANMLKNVSQNAGVKFSGVGIGSTGPVDPFTGDFGEVDFLPKWRGKSLVKDLARIFNVSAAMENDGDAGALGEAGWGAGKNKSRLIYVTLGTGIGGGIILDGKLYRGVDGAHPEVGHQVIDPSGPLCSCGYRGCWESLAAGPAMAAWLEAASPSDYPHRSGLTAKRICQLAGEGDALARSAVDREAKYLGLGLANLINLFTPDAIVLGGSIMKSSNLFLDGICETIRRGCRFVPFEKTQLLLASLGENANLIGAAMVWHHRFGNNTHRTP
jgi:glucokinase